MKKVLFITSESVADPKRGTPIRILNFMRQIAKEFELHVSAPGVDPELKAIVEPYVAGTNLRSILLHVRTVRRQKIDIIMAATDIGIALPVFIKLLTGVPIAVDLHGLYSQEMLNQGHMGATKAWLVQRKTNLCLMFYDLIFTVSPKLSSYYNFIRKPVEYIYGGVNEDEFHSSPTSRPGIFTIGYTGNAKGYQGVDYLLVAASNIRKQGLFPFRLNLIMSSGIGESEARLKELNLSDVTDFHSKVSHDKVNELISASSVLVIPRPSLPMTEYAYPTKLPEYLATGVPVIVTSVGPVPDLLKHKDNALIIGASDIAGNLERELVAFQAMDVAAREQIGTRAATFVRQELSWDTLGKKINGAVTRVL